MTIAPGTRIGPHDVVSLIGSGGMGEVYRARDTRLGREVAIKVLPASFSADADRLQRFEREARAAAALSHPNILTVHEVGRHDPPAGGPPIPYVVSELLEGRTLREAIAESPAGMPVRKAIDIAIQIANGLAAAHEKGIVHRDIKPENVFITRDGRVKILDFGLAKLREGAMGAGASALTQEHPETEAGMVLGTVGYMSPEQVRGQPADHRSDIFSFGAVFYEMLSGARAFAGATKADTMTAILAGEPPELTGRGITPAFDRIVRHCLEKVPELRFQSARDVVFNIEALSTISATGSVALPPPPRTRRVWYAVAAALALASAAAIGLWRVVAAPRGSPVFHQVTFRHGEIDNARFTPDGRSLVYAASWEGAPPEVFTVDAKESGGRPLGIPNARLLAVSNTGELALALAPTRISRYLVAGTFARGSMAGGGAPKPEIESVAAADYAPDGQLAIVRFVPDQRVCQLEYPIGTVLFRNVMLTDLRFSRDGRYLAFIDHPGNDDDRGAAVILRATGEKVATGPFANSQHGLAWSPAGDEIWLTSPLSNGVMTALDLKGRVHDVLNVPGRLFARDVAADGRVLLDQGDTRAGIVVVSDNGASQRDASWLDSSFLKGISRDGRTIIFEEQGNAATSGYRTFVRNVDGSPAIEMGVGYIEALSDDKAWTLSVRQSDGNDELWLAPVGAGQPRRIALPGLTKISTARFLPDGKRIALIARGPSGRARTYIQSLDGGAPRPITDEGTIGSFSSPDMRWIAVRTPAGFALAPVDGGALRPIPGAPEPLLRGWSDDGQIYVVSGPPTLQRIDKLNPLTGVRTLWRELHAPAIVGVTPEGPYITPDGRTYAYSYTLGFSDLFVLGGAR